MRTTLIIALLFITFAACAQIPLRTRELRITPRTDSITVSGLGKIAYDAVDEKLRFNDGTGWFSYLKEGATLPHWPLSGSATIEEEGGARIQAYDTLDIFASGDFFSTYGFIRIGLGEPNSPLFWLEFDPGQNLIGVRGTVMNYDSEYALGSPTNIPHKAYVDSKLAGEDIPAGSTATEGQIIVKSGGDWVYQDPFASGVGSGLSVDGSNNIILGSSSSIGNVADDIYLAWDNATGSRPSVTFGTFPVPYDSMAFETNEKGFHFRSEGGSPSAIAYVIISADSGMVYYAGAADLPNNELIRWAYDYTSYNTFTDLALAPKKYVDDQIEEKATDRIKAQTVSTGNLAGGATADVTLTWTDPFADANYVVNATIFQPTGVPTTNAIRVHHVRSITNTQVIVTVVNDDPSNQQIATLHVTGIHQ